MPINTFELQPAPQSPISQKIFVDNQVTMSQKCIDPWSADRIKTLTIWSLLPTKYHYNFKVTKSGKICSRFGFHIRQSPKCLTHSHTYCVLLE